MAWGTNTFPFLLMVVVKTIQKVLLQGEQGSFVGDVSTAFSSAIGYLYMRDVQYLNTRVVYSLHFRFIFLQGTELY